MKKSPIIVILAAIVILSILSGCSPIGNKLERDAIGKGNIGDFFLEILGYAVDVNENNTPVIYLKILFENKSDDTACFNMVADVDVFQNGIGLKPIYTDEAGSTSVQTGASIEVILAYYLMDESDVDIEISDVLGEYDEKIKRTLQINIE